MENSLRFAQKTYVECRAQETWKFYKPGNSTIRFALKRSKVSNRNLYTNVHNSIVYNIKMVQTGMSTTRVLIQWASWKGT